jgi:hypothetical protein
MSARASATRRPVRDPAIDPLRARHLKLSQRPVATPDGPALATVDDGESPLGWLARRKGRDGRALIAPVQLLAGERLRADFTHAQMTPRVTANWSAPVCDGPQGGEPLTYTEAAVAARQRLRMALDVAGPEFSGLLLDVCCFLKTLPDVEQERGWPARSAKVVLQLGLDRLARHYRIATEQHGPRAARVRTWMAEGETFRIAMPEDAAPS